MVIDMWSAREGARRMNFLIKIVNTRVMFIRILLGCLKCMVYVDIGIKDLFKEMIHD